MMVSFRDAHYGEVELTFADNLKFYFNFLWKTDTNLTVNRVGATFLQLPLYFP